MAGDRKPGTIVLVHGAWCDGSVWTNVLTTLAHEGYSVRSAQLPLKSYEGDVAAVELLLDHIKGPVLLVGHSYAGAVISAAGNNPKVVGLAYVCAFAPEADEVFGSLLAMHPAAEQMTIGPDANGFLWLDAPFASAALGHDLHRGVIHLAVAVQKPTSYKLFESKLSDPAWKRKPTAYLVTTEDRILAPATQRELAKRIHARVEEVAASHLVVLSQPAAVAQFIRASAETLEG
ncbi:alpha/beta hydrolase [Acidipila sp. EB88]|nr:alpha/beta hydrolase [Acidipila sp. EB88]